jgi:hypothetical protein
MTHVYLEPTAILLAGGLPAGAPLGAGSHPARGVTDAIDNLREAGHDVFLFREPASSDQQLSEIAASTGLQIAGIPEQPPGLGGWLITADPRHCERRLVGVRTILVGPRRPPGPRPTAHCDVQARDLGAAAIEVLTREAMS